MSAPTLRFKGFADTWTLKKLGDETVWSSGGTPSKQEAAFWDGDIPWISASSMRGNSYADSELKITEAGLKGSKLAKKGDLLLLVRGSMLFNKIPVGIVARDLAFNQDVKSIKPKNSLTSDFLLSWFSASENKLMNMVSGTGIGAGKLDTQDMMAMDLWIPCQAEQTKIANFLTAVDEKLAKLTRKHDLLTQYKKGVMQQIFSQELRFKDDNGCEFPDWKEEKLGAIGKVSMCKRILKVQTSVNGDVPFYKIGTFGKQADAYITQELYEKFRDLYPFPKTGDILISAAGTIGRTVVYDGKPSYFQDSNIVWIDNDESFVLNRFLIYCYETIEWTTENTTIARLYNDNLKSVYLEFPTLAEQTKIANFLTAIDDKITAAKTQLEAVKQYKQGLLQQMFV